MPENCCKMHPSPRVYVTNTHVLALAFQILHTKQMPQLDTTWWRFFMRIAEGGICPCAERRKILNVKNHADKTKPWKKAFSTTRRDWSPDSARPIMLLFGNYVCLGYNIWSPCEDVLLFVLFASKIFSLAFSDVHSFSFHI